MTTEVREPGEGLSRDRYSEPALAGKIPDYLAKRIDFDPGPPTPGCWLWLSMTTPDGYPITRIHGKRQRVARVVFEIVNGYKPDTVEHQCHTNSTCTEGRNCLHRRCLNPLHMISVTPKENAEMHHSYWANQTHCKHGHELTEENVLIREQHNRPGYYQRVCRSCRRHYQRAYYKRKKAQQ